MEITVIRSGGFAGVHERLGPVDTSSLDAERAQEIEAKVEEAGFFELPDELPQEREIRDGFGYRMTISADGKEHDVSYGDGSEQAAAKRLGELVRLLEDDGASFEDEERHDG